MNSSLCEICGEPMPPSESMFKFHGYSGDCPKPPLPHIRENEVIKKYSNELWNACYIIRREKDFQSGGINAALLDLFMLMKKIEDEICQVPK